MFSTRGYHHFYLNAGFGYFYWLHRIPKQRRVERQLKKPLTINPYALFRGSARGTYFRTGGLSSVRHISTHILNKQNDVTNHYQTLPTIFCFISDSQNSKMDEAAAIPVMVATSHSISKPKYTCTLVDKGIRLSSLYKTLLSNSTEKDDSCGEAPCGLDSLPPCLQYKGPEN